MLGRPESAPLLVPGTLVVAYLLATGRWGSYLGLPSQMVFLTDLALAVTASWQLFGPHRADLLDRHLLVRLVAPAALLAWALVRLVTGLRAGGDVVRDLAPFAYIAVAGFALVVSSRAGRRRTYLACWVALLLHAAWVALSIQVPSLAPSLPMLGGRVHVLELRSDFDGAVLAVLVGLALHEALRGPRAKRLLSLAVAAGAALLVLQIPNRAAFLALLVALLLTLVAHTRTLVHVPRRYLVAGLVVLLAAAVVVLPRTDLYKRVTGDPAYGTNTAAGSVQARTRAWKLVLRYVDDSPQRVLVGTGFGTDFVTESGAGDILRQTTDVRSPHTFVLTAYARLGVVGLALWLWVLLATALRGLRLLRAGPAEVDRFLLPCLVAGTLLATSLLGVILESPFGAVPFYWAVGLILVGTNRSDDVQGAAPPAVRAEPAGPEVSEVSGRRGG